jgi:hypothetical protein
MDEGRKRVIGIMAAILASLHMQTANDLFGGDCPTSTHIGRPRRVIWFGREIFRWEPRSDFPVLLRWPVVYRRFQDRPEFNDLITATTFVTRWAFEPSR